MKGSSFFAGSELSPAQKIFKRNGTKNGPLEHFLGPFWYAHGRAQNIDDMGLGHGLGNGHGHDLWPADGLGHFFGHILGLGHGLGHENRPWTWFRTWFRHGHGHELGLVQGHAKNN